jgi:alginate O-acetyltransferase complex protein AlgI
VVFSSVIFIFYFLPVFLLGYYVSGWRAGALLAGSAAFYVWGEGGYLFLLLGLIGFNYAGSRWLDLTSERRRRLAILAALVILDFAVLGFFKYSEFLAHNLNLPCAMPSCPRSARSCPSESRSSPSSWSATPSTCTAAP